MPGCIYLNYHRYYSYGKPFTVKTNHGSLKRLMNLENPPGKIARWTDVLVVWTWTLSIDPIDFTDAQMDWAEYHVRSIGIVMIYTSNVWELRTLWQYTSKMISLLRSKEYRTNIQICLFKFWVFSSNKPEYKAIASGGYFLDALWNRWPSLPITDEREIV